MEYTNAELPSKTKHDKIIEMACDAAVTLVDSDAVTTQVIIEKLNKAAFDEALISSPMLIKAAFVVRTHNKLNLKTGSYRVSSIPDDSENELVEGIFTGFTTIRHSGGQTLMYHLETGFDPETMSFYTATIPVEGSRVVSRNFEQDEATYAFEKMKESLELLDEIKDSAFVRLFDEFITIIADRDVANAFYFAKLGAVAEEMLEHNDVKGREAYETAITKVISSQLDPSAVYSFVGQLFIPADIVNKKTAGIDYIRGVTLISDVQLINNYIIDEAKKTMTIEETMQPVFIALDSEGNKCVIPLKHLEVLDVVDEFDD